MILDNQLFLADKQAVTTSADGANVYDLGKDGIDIGAGENLFVVAEVTTDDLDASGSATVQVNLTTDDNSSLTTDTVVQQIGSFARGDKVGKRIVARLQPATLERYLGVQFVVGTGPLTAGGFSVYLTKDVDLYKAYQSGFTVAD